MRGAQVIVVVLLSCCLGSSQQSSSAPTALNTPSKITGCLMNMNGNFYLTTANGERLILIGKHSAMFSHNGQQVEITVKPDRASSPQANPKKVTVTHIEMVAQICQ